MSTGWVAGSVRARAMTDGASDGARPGPCRERRRGCASRRWSDRRTATTSARARPWPRPNAPWPRRCCGTCGCSPAGRRRRGVTMLRLLAGCDRDRQHRRAPAPAGRRREPPPPYRLGALATAWPRLAGTHERGRGARRRWPPRAWGDPGGDDAARRSAWRCALSWADRVLAAVPAAAAWAAGRGRAAGGPRGRRRSGASCPRGARSRPSRGRRLGGRWPATPCPSSPPRCPARRAGRWPTSPAGRPVAGGGALVGAGRARRRRRCLAARRLGPERRRRGRAAGRRRLAGPCRARAGRPRRRARWRSSMRWRDALHPVRHAAGRAAVRRGTRCATLLVGVAEQGPSSSTTPSRARATRATTATPAAPRCSGRRPADDHGRARADDARPGRAGSRTAALDLLAGEAQLERASRARRYAAAAWPRWPDGCPRDDAGRPRGPARRRRRRGGPAARPAGSEPPTLLPDGRGVAREFAPLVETYATVPYVDLNPSVIAGLAYVLMFGMMFADVGQGALLAAAGARGPRWRGRRGWRGCGRCGCSSPAPGLPAWCSALLYGEFFGPTGVAPGRVARAAGPPGAAARRRRSGSARCCWPARTRSAP